MKRYTGYLFFIAVLFMPLSHLFAQAATPADATVRPATPVPTDSLIDNTQHKDTVKIDSALAEKKAKRHSATKAALFSMALPGLGQAYNRHYWKIPIVYAGFGGLGYALYYTASNFTGYRNAYRYNLAHPNVITPAEFAGTADVGELKDRRDAFKKNMDIPAICTGVWYLLVVVDAAVDAHLMEWNMKDDLSVAWHPTLLPSYNGAPTAFGATVRFGF